MIKLFTMVRDEVDIIEDWILYHGTLFGFENLYIVDNVSTDGTYEIIKKYEKNGVHVYSHSNYKEKGNIMKQLIDNNKCVIAFPLDIDEFIVFYDKEKRTISTDTILPYLEHLIKLNNNQSTVMNMKIHGVNRNCGLYKCDYINSKVTSSNENGYEIGELNVLYRDYIKKNSIITPCIDNDKIIEILTYFWENIQIEGNKFLYGWSSNLWDKPLDIDNSIDLILRDNEKLPLIELYREYTTYQKVCSGYIVSKQYFDKYVEDTHSSVIKYMV